MNKSIDDYVNDFVSRHSKFGAVRSDKRYKHMKDVINNWLEPVEEPHKQYFLDLFRHLEYFGNKRIGQSYKKVYDRYINEFGTDEDSVFYVVEKTTGMYNAAYHLMFEFETATKVNSYRLYANARSSYRNEDYSNVKNIVLIDDILGSGSTIKNYIRNLMNDCPDIFTERKLYLIVLVSVSDGIKVLNDFCKKNKLDLTILSFMELRKAFLGDYIFKRDECENISSIIRGYEEKIAERKDDIMGFRNSQALVAFHYNTPNNTLCTFWRDCQEHKWISIFPRREDDKSKALPRKSQLQNIKDKKERENNINFNLKAFEK